MEDKIKIIQDLVDRCEKCQLNECINCEIRWIEVQVIKELLKKKRKVTINGAEIYKGKAIL